jgi:hypothetical protein
MTFSSARGLPFFGAVVQATARCGVLATRVEGTMCFSAGPVVGSIPTAPTNHLLDWSGFKQFARGQKGADTPIDPVLVR